MKISAYKNDIVLDTWKFSRHLANTSPVTPAEILKDINVTSLPTIGRIVVPIHVASRSHWVFAVGDFARRVVTYVDPLIASNSDESNFLRKWRLVKAVRFPRLL